MTPMTATQAIAVRKRGNCKELFVRVYFIFGGYMDGFIPNDLLLFNPVSVVIKAPREDGERRRQTYTFERGVVAKVIVKGLS